MAVLRASPLLLPQPLSPASSSSHPTRPTCRRVTAAAIVAVPPSLGVTTGIHGSAQKRVIARGRSGAERRSRAFCLPTKEGEVGVARGDGKEVEEDEDEYLVREAGWGVRPMGRVGEEMRRVAQVQAEAFHVPVALFNDFFYDFFKVRVLVFTLYR